MIISKSQAKQIADQADQILILHQENDQAQKLLEEIKAGKHMGHVFGGYQLRVPISASVARGLVLAHIANNEQLLVDLSAKVRAQLNAVGVCDEI